MQPLLFSLLVFSPSLSLLLISVFLVGVILELIGRKKSAFGPFFTQMATNFVRFVFKKSASYTPYSSKRCAKLFFTSPHVHYR